MSLYLDTSVVVSVLTREPATAATQTWLAAQDAGELAISEWVVTEFSSALSIKLRTGALDPSQRARALSAFTRLRTESLTVLTVEREAFRSAARFADQHELTLRAGDALDLAICAQHGLELCTLDRVQAQAGSALGVPTRLL